MPWPFFMIYWGVPFRLKIKKSLKNAYFVARKPRKNNTFLFKIHEKIMKIFKSALTTFNVWKTCQRYTLSEITPSNDKGLHCNMQHAKGRLEPHFYYINLNYDFPYKCYFFENNITFTDKLYITKRTKLK